MPTPIRLFLPLALACLAGCPVWEPLASCADYDACGTTAMSSSSEGMLPTTSASDGIQTVTGASDDEGSSSTGSKGGVETGDSTGMPAELPTIIDYLFTPNPIDANGPLAVTVTAEHAAGVRMDTGLGDVVELMPLPQPGVFSGEIPVLTGLINGPHAALVTPWQDGVDGGTVEVPYQIALPTPGSQKLWETGDLIGPGQVVALATLPTGELVELGTRFPNGEPRCFLRLRDKDGLWAPAEVVDVLPDTPCMAIDLKSDDQGALFVLVNQQSNDGLRWRLMTLAAWGQSAKHMGLGAKDEVAVALAHHESGMVGVCGTAPSGQPDEVDAMAQIFRPGLPVEPWVIDYWPADKNKAHRFAEQARDCVFVGDTLALVGEAHGPHGVELMPRDRLFILRLDTVAKTTGWTVALPGDKLQSGAQAVDVDGEGRLVIGGYTCDDDCKPVGDLRIYDGQDALAYQVSLGPIPTKQFAVQDLTWSPAGYAVVATGGMPGNEAAFTVRAFAPHKQEAALWTFTRNDLQVLHLALTLAVGNYGEVYAGGFGANGYPAVAFIFG